MGHILVVEDDPDICDILCEILRLDRHEVDVTASGRDAVLRVEADHYDLVILDLQIEELSGRAAGRAIADLATVPVLAMSASGGPWQAEALRSGATACMAKPFDVPSLLELVDALVHEPHRAGALPQLEMLATDDVRRLAALGPAGLDALPYGVIQVDREGRIVGFNRYEAGAARLAPEEVLGRRFDELAPCTRVRSFARAVTRGFAERRLDEVLRFVFPSYGALSVVTVRLYFDEELDRMWIFVSRSAAPRQVASAAQHPS